MADAYVQVQVDQAGKKVDTSEITVGANTVERQRNVLADDTDAYGVAGVDPNYGLGVDVQRLSHSGVLDLLTDIRTELKIMNSILNDGLNQGADLSKLRIEKEFN